MGCASSVYDTDKPHFSRQWNQAPDWDYSHHGNNGSLTSLSISIWSPQVQLQVQYEPLFACSDMITLQVCGNLKAMAMSPVGQLVSASCRSSALRGGLQPSCWGLTMTDLWRQYLWSMVRAECDPWCRREAGPGLHWQRTQIDMVETCISSSLVFMSRMIAPTAWSIDGRGSGSIEMKLCFST